MKELIVCKSCGFVMDKSKLKDKCPACGVSSKMFLPYTDPVSPRRRLLLSLDIHPVLVHFPQAFSTVMVLLSIAAFFPDGELREKLTATIGVIGTIFPVTVALAFIAGLIDGKIRFRRIRTPLLVRKMLVGGIFFLCSIAVAGLIMLAPSGSAKSLGLILFFSIISLGCASLLGLWGASLQNSKFPG
jgi:uncharacterized membrane protein